MILNCMTKHIDKVLDYPELAVDALLPSLNRMPWMVFLVHDWAIGRSITADIVANSNAWYNLWVDASYVPENMSYSLDFLKNNTTDSLYLKCVSSMIIIMLVNEEDPSCCF